MKAVSEHYLGGHGVDYFAGRFGAVSEYGRIFQSLYFRPHCDAAKHLLDFGCGDGTILRALAASRKIGVEVNLACREFIQQKNASTSPPIEVFDDLSAVGARSVDVAIANHSLEHVLEPLHTLRELHRVLVPGGRLVVVTPFDDWRCQRNRGWIAGDKDHHLFTWSPMNMGNLLGEGGFEVQDARLCAQAWSPKLFWIGRVLGFGAFRVACRGLAVLKNRREVVSVARKPVGA